MAEVEDVDVVVTLMSDMVGDCEETIMDNIIMLGEYGITVETVNDEYGWILSEDGAGRRQGRRRHCFTYRFYISIFSSVSELTDRRLYE